MKYDFDRIINRKNTLSTKWDYMKEFEGGSELLPLWVADMDFLCPQPVIEAIVKRSQHGIYGYADIPKSMSEVVAQWVKRRHGWEIKNEWILFIPGVVTAIKCSIRAYTDPGDKILIQTPVYTPFFTSIEKNGRQIVQNPLKLVNGRYEMDFEDLENKLKENVKMMILCSPHNPGGRVWNKEELSIVSELCSRQGVILVSDEIHSDIIFKGRKHIPVASLSEKSAQNAITCIAPSKTFNIAGLSSSVVIIPDSSLREIYNKEIASAGYDINLIGIVAMEAAYKYGEEWLDQMLDYLEGNLDFLVSYISEKIPEISLIKPEGTYLGWMDFNGLNMDQDNLNNMLIKKAKVFLNDGRSYGKEGLGFKRINFACPRSLLCDAISRIEKAVRD